MDAAGPQRCEIRPGRRVLPHVDVHRGSDDDRSLRGEIKSPEEIFGDPVSELSENVCRCGSDEQQINALRDGDVFDGALDVGGGRLLRDRTSR